MKETVRYKYFQIEPQEKKPGRKTREYLIINHSQGAEIGSIKWYGSWRQYCVFFEEGTIWSSGCMDDVKDFMKRLKEER